MSCLNGKTVFITGGSRGIGKAIALRVAREGANVVIAAKTDQPHPKLPGTIYSVAAEIEAAGGSALPLVLDVRDGARITEVVDIAARSFGGIDVLINNASAVFLGPVEQTPAKRFDLIFDINVRGTFLASQACAPYLKKSQLAQIITLSPPLDLSPTWFRERTAYTMSKYGMSMTVLGFAEELRSSGVTVNALWPRTMIYTEATAMFGFGKNGCRTTEIMSDAVYAILAKPNYPSGQLLIDEDVLRDCGVEDFAKYEVVPGAPLLPDLFV